MHMGSASWALVLGIFLFCAALFLFFPQASHAAVVYSQLLNEATSTDATLVFYKIPAGTDVPGGLKFIELIAASPANGHGFRATIICRRFSNYTGTCSEMPDFSVTTAGTSTTKAPTLYRMPFTAGSTTPLSSTRFYAFGIQRTSGDAAGIHLRGIATSTCIITGCGLPGTPYVVLADAFEPEPPSCTENCFSNVLFLPGVKGSRLVFGSDQLWPPTIWSNDVPQLALDESGESVNPIQVDGILDEFAGTDIYLPFSKFLEGLVEDGTINEWHPFAYDWRYSPQRVVDEDVHTTAGAVNLVETVEALAENSKSGKVTIVAHSMGGLVGKALIKKLELEGKADLIESFVMVGTPQLGTPQAIASLLHGDEEGILRGHIVNPSHARTLARTLPSAHALLPSQKYFDTVLESVIHFSETASFTEPWRAVWGSFINAYTPLFEFMTGQGVLRERPAEELLRIPEVLNAERLSDAMNFHAEYDSYEFPESIRVVQIAGWGRPTVKAVEYRDEHGEPSYRTSFTAEGDGTVVYPSAVPLDGTEEKYFFNIFEFNDISELDIQHRDLLTSAPVQIVVDAIVKKEVIAENNFISIPKPLTDDIPDRLIVQAHSPVVLGAYDTLGNFTGIDQSQDFNAEILSVREEIPGSTFISSSESQYLFLPKSGQYTLVYQGIGNGSTTIEIQAFSSDTASTTATFTDIPTSEEASASLALDASAPEVVTLELDADGDGIVDTILESDENSLTLEELFVLFKETLESIEAQRGFKQSVLRRVEALEHAVGKNEVMNEQMIENITKDIEKGVIQERVLVGDAQVLIRLLDRIKEAL